MLVTPDGRWVLEDSAEFLAALGDPKPDYDAASFAVTNLGFVKFQMLDQSVIEIELHPHTVELPALLAVQQQLVTSTVRLFRIRYLTTSWQSEILHAPSLRTQLPSGSRLVRPPAIPKRLLEYYHHAVECQY
jgi:hypothetical protein